MKAYGKNANIERGKERERGERERKEKGGSAVRDILNKIFKGALPHVSITQERNNYEIFIQHRVDVTSLAACRIFI